MKVIATFVTLVFLAAKVQADCSDAASCSLCYTNGCHWCDHSSSTEISGSCIDVSASCEEGVLVDQDAPLCKAVICEDCVEIEGHVWAFESDSAAGFCVESDKVPEDYEQTEVCSVIPTASTTDSPVSEGSSTGVAPTTAVSIESSTTGIPAEESSTTEVPAAESSTTGIPAEKSSTTGIPAQESSTTGVPAEESSTTGIPAQESSTTGVPESSTTGVVGTGTEAKDNTTSGAASFVGIAGLLVTMASFF